MRRYFLGWCPGKWLVFFSVQGPLLALEALVKAAGKRMGVKLPVLLAIPCTLGILLLLADKYFIPPVVDTGLVDLVLHSIQRTYGGKPSFS